MNEKLDSIPEDKMPPETLEALRGSIAKWEAIVAGTGVDLGAENCPLCRKFNPDLRDDHLDDGCQGCPVREYTGENFCRSTPYDACDDPPTKTQAQDELEFLKSLLPKEAA